MLLRFARSLRDPWVLGQLALFALVGGGVQLAGDRLAGPPAPGSRPAALTLMILATLLILAAIAVIVAIAVAFITPGKFAISSSTG